jgi:predicted Zn-dependent protease
MKQQGGTSKHVRGSAGAIEGALREGAAALQSGRAADAERIAREVLARHPRHAGALQLLGMTLLAQNRARDAIAPLEEAARVRPGAACDTYLAIALRKTGRPTEALPLLQRAVGWEPPIPHAFYELGTLLYEQRRIGEAESVLRQGMKVAPGAPEFSLALGTMFLDRGDTESAESAFARVLAGAPAQPAALHGLGSSLMGRGEFERAADKFRQAVTRDPSDARAQLLLASCLFELGKTEEGIERLRALMRAAPALLGQAIKACVESGRGRLWLKPSAAAHFLGVRKSG